MSLFSGQLVRGQFVGGQFAAVSCRGPVVRVILNAFVIKNDLIFLCVHFGLEATVL